jgi:hypothetical protein
MLETVVHYLHSRDVPFRLDARGSHAPLPRFAYAASEGVQLVDAHFLFSGSGPLVAVVPTGTNVSEAALSTELGAAVLEPSRHGLRVPFDPGVPLPALGGVLGASTVVDAAVRAAPRIAFRAFSPNDFVELAYDDFALIEHPRVCTFATLDAVEEHPAGEP